MIVVGVCSTRRGLEGMNNRPAKLVASIASDGSTRCVVEDHNNLLLERNQGNGV
jgi:hypothetical protein